MKTSLLCFKATIIAAILLTAIYSNAATFTAVASGNWSVGATWGGTAPSFNLTSDQVIIPAGDTITLDSTLTINGVLASLTVNGTLSGTAADTLNLGLGSITGMGSININALVFNAGATFAFAGRVVVNTLTNYAASLAIAVNVTINQSLTLAGGAFIVQPDDTLNLSANSTIILAGGLLSTSGGLLALTNSYNVTYTSATATGGLELSGTGLNNLTIDVPSNDSVKLSSNVVVNGTLSLDSGTLWLNDNNLTISGIAAGGGGWISSTGSSNISVVTGSSPLGSLQFTANGSSVGNLVVNVGGSNGTLVVNSALVVSDSLNFVSGTLNIGSNSLNIASGGVITGAGNSSYVIASGGGYLKMQATAGAGTLTTFPVGTSDHYSPVAVQLNSGSASGGISVYAMDGVDAQGTTGTDLSVTQPAVDVTYFVEPDSTTNTNLNLQLMWSASMQVNGFSPDSAYISHFTAGAWDTSAVSVATYQGSLYSLTRSNITTFSPFGVFGADAVTTGIAEIENGNSTQYFNLYPNPVYDNLVVHNLTGNTNIYIDIINVSGQIINTFELNNDNSSLPLSQLAAGTYFIRLYNSDVNEVHKVIKMD